MPLCEGRSDGPGHLIPCPQRRVDSTVRGRQGDLMLCDDCNDYRFPVCSVSESVKTKRNMKTNAKHEYNTRGRSSSTHQLDVNNTNVTHDCPQCCEPADDGCIVCSICGDFFHQLCTGISASAYDTLMSVIIETGWVCPTCRISCKFIINGLQSALARTNELVSDMKTVIDTLKNDIDTLKSSRNTCKDNISCSDEQQILLADNVGAQPISLLHPSTHTLEVSKVMHDLNRRKKNIVISGLPEPTGNTADELQSADITAFEHLCEANLPVKPSVSKLGCKRLGKLSDNNSKPRKLLVYLGTETAASSILQCAKLLRRSDNPDIARNVFVNPDLSPAEAKLAFESRQKRRNRISLKDTSHTAHDSGDMCNTTPTLATADFSDCGNNSTVLGNAVTCDGNAPAMKDVGRFNPANIPQNKLPTGNTQQPFRSN